MQLKKTDKKCIFLAMSVLTSKITRAKCALELHELNQKVEKETEVVKITCKAKKRNRSG